MKRDGMQMGESGYGLTHGYGEDEEYDDDNSHEYRGSEHGVSDSWVQKRTSSGAKKASNDRIAKFEGKMFASGTRREAKGDWKGADRRFNAMATARDHAKLPSGKDMNSTGKKGKDARAVHRDHVAKVEASAKKESGWDRWKAKKGK